MAITADGLKTWTDSDDSQRRSRITLCEGGGSGPAYYIRSRSTGSWRFELLNQLRKVMAEGSGFEDEDACRKAVREWAEEHDFTVSRGMVLYED
jgi:hypothetical protein